MQAPLQPTDIEACAGLFRLSRLLHAAVRLGIAPALARGPRSAGELAAAVGTHPGATRALLDALAAWGIVAHEAGRGYTLTPVSRRLLPGEPDGANLRLIAGWAGLDAVFEAFAGVEHTVRTGECGLRRHDRGGFHERLAADPDQAAQYQAAMSSTTQSFGACAAALGDVDGTCIVDIGGGHGDLLAAVLARHPRARGLCVDLPHVVHGRAPRLQGRLRFEAADAFRQLPPGADLYLTSTVLRCFDDASALVLLRSIRAAMTRHGARLVSFEIVLPPGRDDPWLALANLTAHVVYGGRDRTADEFRELLGRAGLVAGGIVPVDGALHAITATCGEPGAPSPCVEAAAPQEA